MSIQSMNNLILKEGHLWYMIKKEEIMQGSFLYKFIIGDGLKYFRGIYLTDIKKIQISLIKSNYAYCPFNRYIISKNYHTIIEQVYDNHEILENIFTKKGLLKIWNENKHIDIDIEFLPLATYLLDQPLMQVCYKVPTLQEYLIMNKLVPKRDIEDIFIPYSMQKLVNKYYY